MSFLFGNQTSVLKDIDMSCHRQKLLLIQSTSHVHNRIYGKLTHLNNIKDALLNQGDQSMAYVIVVQELATTFSQMFSFKKVLSPMHFFLIGKTWCWPVGSAPQFHTIVLSRIRPQHGGGLIALGRALIPISEK